MASIRASVKDEDVQDHDGSTLCEQSLMAKAEEFIATVGSTIHPIFGSTTTEVTKDNVPQEHKRISSSTQRHIEEFLETMDSHKSDYSIRLLDLRATHSWDDMVKAANDAHRRYVTAGNHPIRKAGQWAAAHTEMVQPFLRLIPNDTYLSILYGGLRLVFEAFSNVHEKRLRVLKSFLRIPNIILMAESCVQNFPSDDMLFQRAEAVFCAALPAIEGTIRWLKQSSMMKPLRALVLGPVYTKSYKEKVQTLDEALDELKERATVLSHQAIQKVEKTVDNVQSIVNHTDIQMIGMSEDIRSVSRVQDETREKIETLQDLKKVEEQAKEALRVVLEQTVMCSQWMKDKDRAIRRLKKQVEALERAEVDLTENDLLNILGVGENVVSQDFRHIQRACQSIELSEIQSVTGIAQGSKLQSLLQTDASSALFIEGGASSLQGRNTSLSFLCTSVIENLRNKGPAVPIYFFCGPHTSMRDPLCGPVGIMKSLLSQVVRISSPKLDFISRHYHQQLKSLHLYTLCDCFCKLVRKLPNATVVVCIIDGVSFVETNEWARDCKEIMSQLQGLLDDDNLNPVFKLLVTSPVRSRHAASTFSDAFRLILTPENTSNARQKPSEREIATANIRPSRSGAGGRRFAPFTRRKRYFLTTPTRRQETSQYDTDSDSSTSKNEAVSGVVSEMEVDRGWPDMSSSTSRSKVGPDLST